MMIDRTIDVPHLGKEGGFASREILHESCLMRRRRESFARVDSAARGVSWITLLGGASRQKGQGCQNLSAAAALVAFSRAV